MQFLVSDDQLESSKVYDVFLDDPKKLSNNSSENHLSILRKVKAFWEKVVLHKVIKIESGKSRFKAETVQIAMNYITAMK